MCLSTGGSAGGGQVVRQEAVRFICFGRYNIRNGWNRVLDSALRGMLQANVNLRVFQEKKVTEGIYIRESSGYKLVASEAPGAHSGGIIILYRTEE